MKSVTCLVLVWLSVSNAYVMMETPNPKAPHGICISKHYELGRMTVGEDKDVVGSCMKATCLKGGSIQYEGCIAVDLPPKCKYIEPNREAPFPKCCKYEFDCNREQH